MDIVFDEPLYKFLLIPVSCGVIGYITNVAAVKMMFYPIHFVGIRPFLGWRGIIPSNSVQLVRSTHKLIMERLISIQDIFAKRSPDEFVSHREEAFRERAKKELDRAASTHMGPMWNALSPSMQDQMADQLGDAVIQSARKVAGKIIASVGTLIDIEGMAIETAKKDPEFMNRMFLDVGKQEFIFIERSGLYFGFLFGLVQMATWWLYPAWWVLPAFGLFVGWATNAIAIKLIFEPREKKRLLGLQVQGLFHQRQKEVSIEFGRLITEGVFSNERLRMEFQKPKARDRVLEWVEEEIDAVIADYESHPMRSMIPDALLQDIRSELMETVKEELDSADGMIAGIAAQSEPLREEIQTRMAALDPLSFENVLRPAFQAEEWKLIAAGAVLGLGAGFLQLMYLFGEYWTKLLS